MFLHDVNDDFDGFLLIGPDTEGACPSDLCGMNGHESLAKWLSKRECDYVKKYSTMISINAHGPGYKCRKLLLSRANPPSWISKSTRQTYTTEDGGVTRMQSVFFGGGTSEKLKDTQKRCVNLREID